MKMKPKVFIPAVIVTLFICTACGNSAQPTAKKGSSLKKRQLEEAIFYVETNLESLGEASYVQWTPTTAVANLAETMNAAQILLPEEEQQYRQAGIRPKEAIPYLLEKPTDSWQVVLIADEAQQKIRVEGYGKDLSQPLIVKEIPCCQF